MVALETEISKQKKIVKKNSQDKFLVQMKPIFELLKPELDRVEKTYSFATKTYYQTVAFYGEDPSSLDGEDFFAIFKTFVSSFNESLKAGKEIKKKQMNLVKQMKYSRNQDNSFKLELNDKADERTGVMDDLLESLKRGNVAENRIRRDRKKDSLIADQAKLLLEEIRK